MRGWVVCVLFCCSVGGFAGSSIDDRRRKRNKNRIKLNEKLSYFVIQFELESKGKKWEQETPVYQIY